MKVGSPCTEEFEVKVKHQGSVLSPLLFTIVVGVITENTRRGVVNELLYADQGCGSSYFSTASTPIASASTNKKTKKRPLTIFLTFVGM